MTEQELTKLFNKCTHSIPGTDNIRAIDLNLFLTAAAIISQNAYTKGVTEGLDSLHEAVQTTIKGVLV
jgi:hypothetical protein